MAKIYTANHQTMVNDTGLVPAPEPRLGLFLKQLIESEQLHVPHKGRELTFDLNLEDIKLLKSLQQDLSKNSSKNPTELLTKVGNVYELLSCKKEISKQAPRLEKLSSDTLQSLINTNKRPTPTPSLPRTPNKDTSNNWSTAAKITQALMASTAPALAAIASAPRNAPKLTPVLTQNPRSASENATVPLNRPVTTGESLQSLNTPGLSKENVVPSPKPSPKLQNADSYTYNPQDSKKFAALGGATANLQSTLGAALTSPALGMVADAVKRINERNELQQRAANTQSSSSHYKRELATLKNQNTKDTIKKLITTAAVLSPLLPLKPAFQNIKKKIKKLKSHAKAKRPHIEQNLNDNTSANASINSGFKR